MKNVPFNSVASSNALRFLANKTDHTWLCASITQAPKAVESCSKAQKTWQVF